MSEATESRTAAASSADVGWYFEAARATAAIAARRKRSPHADCIVDIPTPMVEDVVGAAGWKSASDDSSRIPSAGAGDAARTALARSCAAFANASIELA